MPDTQARLSRCFLAVFPELSNAQIASASVETLPAWDSVASVTLVALIEEEFGMKFELDALDRLVSFRAILDCLKRTA